MKTKEEINLGLAKLQSTTASRWRENAQWRIDNKSWLRYSQRIAMMMLDKMEELGLTQKSLAEKLCCSQQYVSRVLKGRENLSIETIAKIEAALQLDILQSALPAGR